MSELVHSPLVAQGAAESPSLWAILRSVWRAISGAPPSERARRIFDLVWPDIESVGRDLTSAVDLDDLDDRIDASLERGMHAESWAEVDASPLMNEPAREPRHVEWPEELFGGVAAAKLRRMEQTLDVLMPIHQELLKSREERRTAREAENDEARGALSFLVDPSLPPPIKAALLDYFRADQCFLAIAYIVMSRRAPEPWLRLALAERADNGYYQYLRFWASIPELNVPFDIVPASDRFDLEALYHKTSIADARMREFAATDGPTFPFMVDDDS